MPKSYTRPPILESTIQVSFSDKGSDANNLRFSKEFEKDHKKVSQIVPQQISFKFSVEKPADSSLSVAPQQASYKASSDDQSEVIICNPDSLIVSQLAPYPGWNVFFNKFCSCWELFTRIFNFRPISRIGVRYVNRLDLPPDGEVVRNEDYLVFYPQIPVEFGNTDGFFLNVTLRRPNIDGIVIINSGIMPTPVENRAGLLFDQDLVSLSDLPKDTRALYERLQKMRDEKNLIFETCVTDKARALFDHD